MLFPALKYKEPLVILQQHTAVVFYLDPGQIIVFPVPCCIPLSLRCQPDHCDLFDHPSAVHYVGINTVSVIKLLKEFWREMSLMILANFSQETNLIRYFGQAC